MFGIGSGEIILILIIVFLLFGPDRLPEIARTIGKFAHDVKKASDDVKTAVMKDAKENLSLDEPPPNPHPKKDEPPKTE